MNLSGNEIFIWHAQNYVSDAMRLQMKAKLHLAGATVFAKIGVALTSNRRRLLTVPTIIDNNMMSATALNGVVSPRFLYLLLDSIDFNSIAAGTAIPYLNSSDLQKLRVSIPSLLRQVDIEQVLGSFDDRITLLRETNTTLEAIAQALFKSWFVDFDPVRANMEGRPPDGMDEATAALFPDGFQESELGEVPAGWRTGTLANLAQQHKGSVSPLRHPNTLFQHFSLPAYDSGQMPVNELGSEIKSNKTTVPADAVLLSKLNPHIPRVWLPMEPTGHAVCSTEFLVFVPASGEASREFVYCTFSSANIQEKFCQLVTGTSNSHQRVKPEGVSRLRIVLPTATVLAAFANVAKPLFNQIGLNRLHAQTLTTLRDMLLPRLISGQLHLPENMDAYDGKLLSSSP